MYVVSKHFGFVLVFENKEQLSTAAEHLRDMAQAAQKNLIKPPYLYSCYGDKEISEKAVQGELKNLKKRLK